MINLNSKKILILTFLIVILILMSALISSLFLIKELRDNNSNDRCKILLIENSADLEGVLKPGTVGEVETDEPQDNPLPPAIFNTAGIITEIKNDRIVISGNGSNFEDKNPREINIIFTDSTAVFISNDQKTKYKGIEGLQNLKVGNEILIEGAENIRGKTEFIAGIINVLL